jgi:hypothetical protein
MKWIFKILATVLIFYYVYSVWIPAYKIGNSMPSETLSIAEIEMAMQGPNTLAFFAIILTIVIWLPWKKFIKKQNTNAADM